MKCTFGSLPSAFARLVGVFDALFKQLMKSVRRFVEIRDSVERVKQAESIAAFMVNQEANLSPS